MAPTGGTGGSARPDLAAERTCMNADPATALPPAWAEGNPTARLRRTPRKPRDLSLVAAMQRRLLKHQEHHRRVILEVCDELTNGKAAIPARCLQAAGCR